MSLPRYEAYKPSGVAWLGEIPAHWEMKKLRTILTPTAIRNRPDLPLLSVVREKGIILRDTENKEANHNFIPEDLSNYKVVQQGQFAMNKMKAWQGSYGVSGFEGIVSPAYYIFDLKEVTPIFFHKALRSQAYVPFFTQASDGVRIGQWDLSQSRMKEIPFWIPPLPEQEAIVRYLDHATHKIDRAVRAKKKLIAALNEQKQAIIAHSVARGIDSSVPMKESGVAWLGEIPVHWDTKHLGVCFSERRQKVSDKVYKPLSVTKNGVVPQLEKAAKTNDGDNRKKVLCGDFVINGRSDRKGSSGLSKLDGSVSLINIVLTPRESLEGAYIHYLLRSVPFQEEYYRNGKGIVADLWSTNISEMRKILLPIPTFQEQQAIVDYLDKETAAIDKAIELSKKEIDLLREYKTRLIADAVTGAVDVRELAMELPEIVEENDDENLLDEADDEAVEEMEE